MPRRGEVIAWLSSAVILIIGALEHEMWRDELQAWAIARASVAPWDIVGELTWERHPPVWHGVLWLPAQILGGIWALHLIGVLIACATAWVVIFRGPWPLWARISLVSGYFILFELGMVVRSWTLIGLLVVLVLAENDRPYPRTWLLVLLLSGLAFTALHALPLAIGLAVSTLGPRFRGRMERAALVVAPIVIAIALYVVLSAPDGGDVQRLRLPTDGLFVDRIKEVIRAIARVAVPVPEFRTTFRETFLVDHSGVLFGLIALVVLFLVTWYVSVTPWVLASWMISMGGLACLVGVTGIPMYGRQSTVVHLTILACLWQGARSSKRSRAVPRPLVTLAALSLGLGLVGAGWAWITEIRSPFSSGADATEFVRKTSGQSDVVVLCPQRSPLCTTVSIRLDTTLHFSGDDPGTEFYEFSNQRRRGNAGPVIDEATRLAERLDADVAVIETAGRVNPVPCRNRWEPSIESITREEITVCMLSDLLPTESSTSP